MGLKKRLTFVCFGITFIIFTAVLLWGRFGKITGGEMGFSVLSFYMIMPLVSLASALLLGLRDAYMKWLYPAAFGVYGLIIPAVVFNSFDLSGLFFSCVPALVGLGAGMLANKFRKRL